MKTLLDLMRRDDGATAIEYGLIAALMALAILGALMSTGNNTGDKWNGVAEDVTQAMTPS